MKSKKVLALMLTGAMILGMGTTIMAAQETEEMTETTESSDHVKLGIQMYNFVVGGDWVNLDSQEGVDELLREIADAGYEGVEWCNFQLAGDLDLEETKKVMDEVGLETIGMHFHYGTEETLVDNIDTCIERMNYLGTDKLIFAYSTPATFGIEADEDGNWTPEQIDEWADKIQGVLDTMKQETEGTDIKVTYHNHATEMQTGTEGEKVFDMIKPDAKEVDVYWTSKGLDGKVQTALDYVKEHDDEVYLLHVKDGMEGSTHTGEMCGWGKGTYDLQSIVDAAKASSNIDWVIVENDSPASFGLSGIEDAMESAEWAHSNIDFAK